MLLQILDIRKLVKKYVSKYSTNNPVELAEYLNIQILYVPLGNISGFYKYIKRHKCIFINSDIEDEHMQRFILAHELGHALLHTRDNCYFLEKKTYIKIDRYENEANRFAIELLIPDDFIDEYSHCSIEQLARLTGYDESLIQCRMNR